MQFRYQNSASIIDTLVSVAEEKERHIKILLGNLFKKGKLIWQQQIQLNNN